MSDRRVAILVPKVMFWDEDKNRQDWYMSFYGCEICPEEDPQVTHIWIDAPQSEAPYPGQLLVVRKTNREVRGTPPESNIFYWEIVRDENEISDSASSAVA